MCAGGGVTGAVYEMGCLRALEDLLDRSMTDLDLYVGVSGGAFVTSLLASGVTAAEMYDAVASRVKSPLGVPAAPLFRLGLGDAVTRSLRFPSVVTEALATVLKGEGRNLADFAFALFELLPAGLLVNTGVQEWLADVFRLRGRSDSFAALQRPLYVVAVDLDSGSAVAFGEPEWQHVPVSRAVQASTALPGLYRPVRINGRDYVDGGVKKTAHINLAIQHGADLVIVINPLVPIHNDTQHGPLGGHLSNKGITYVLDQVLRITLHGRMQYGLERYQAEHPEVDILLLEPKHEDMRMFSYNIMQYGARKVVAEHGYRSVMAAFRENRKAYATVLRRHGMALRDTASLPETPARNPFRSPVARALSGSLDVLDSKLRRPARG